VSEEPEIVALRARAASHESSGAQADASRQPAAAAPAQVVFNRTELATILHLYGTKVAAGEWRDYAMDFNREKAVFAVYRRTSELPLYRIEKNPKLARKQGAYTVITAGGQILRRGHDLAQVLKVLLKKPKLVVA
jgi:hypothetical protein